MRGRLEGKVALITGTGGGQGRAAALQAKKGNPTVAHAAAKGGIVAFSRALAAEGLEHNIRVNSIAPGLIETPVLTEHMDEATIASLSSAVPVRRIGKSEDVAYYALFLASDESRFVTGPMLAIDGGASNIRI